MIDGNFFGTQHLFTFLLAAIALNLVPGQDTLYILGRSLAQGRRAGIVSVLGIGTGCLVHILAAALGLYAVLALWPPAFTAICYLGGVYLIWIGIMTWMRRSSAGPAFTAGSGREDTWTIYRQGFTSNVLNPKVALFFIAFLPQFIDPVSNLGALSFLFLGVVFFVTGGIWCCAIVLGASAFADALRKNPKVQLGFDLFASVLFIALGAGVLLFRI